MYDEDTGEKVPLPRLDLLPDVEGHHMVIAEIPRQEGSFKWDEYMAVCSCGSNLQPPRGRYHTKRGATERANRHLRQEGFKTMTETGLVGHQNATGPDPEAPDEPYAPQHFDPGVTPAEEMGLPWA